MLRQASNKDVEQKKEQKKAVVALVDKTGGAQIPKVGAALKPHFYLLYWYKSTNTDARAAAVWC